MKRGISIRTTTLIGERRIATLLGICFAMSVTPAQAQTAGAVEISGYVAPRCWVAHPPLRQLATDMVAPRGRAICNYSAPVLRSSMRTLNADGSLAEYFPPPIDPMPVQTQLSGRAALEIVVSPQI